MSWCWCCTGGDGVRGRGGGQSLCPTPVELIDCNARQGKTRTFNNTAFSVAKIHNPFLFHFHLFIFTYFRGFHSMWIQFEKNSILHFPLILFILSSNPKLLQNFFIYSWITFSFNFFLFFFSSYNHLF